jgi:hypothetical protein
MCLHRDASRPNVPPLLPTGKSGGTIMRLALSKARQATMYHILRTKENVYLRLKNNNK